MNMKNLKKQRGLTMISMLFVGVLFILVALVAIKVVPDLIEFLAITKSVKATAMDPATKTATVAEIRRNFDTRKSIDNIKDFSSAELDISKEGNDIVIAFAYSRKIPLFGPVSLVIDFEGSSAQ
jgi:amino acid transporter